MHTNLHQKYKKTTEGLEAAEIIKSCVHCGFCNATCPTYQELADERDGPRGRIYLVKQLLEGEEVTGKTLTHLDRCLTCRSCETTCPSSVEYGRLIDIGRSLLEEQKIRPMKERLMRWGLRHVLPYPRRFGFLLKLGQAFRPLLPANLKTKIPLAVKHSPWPKNSHPRVMLALAGCVQSATTPGTNTTTARVLDRLGITLLEAPTAGCCGAVSQHLGAPGEAKGFMRTNIDAWWPAIEAGAEAIISTASGCGVMLTEYGYHLRDDPDYAEKARVVSSIAKDISEILVNEELETLKLPANTSKTAVHCPCTLQHGLKQPEIVEQILRRIGAPLVTTREKHLCCGSAGTYSILQPALSQKLLDNKLAALTVDDPEQIVTANVGCHLHLQSQSPVPVKHWIELLDAQS
ncbi:MAG: glycolate oxidase subunit GlcF [Endozoicomonas sp.]